MSNPISQCLFSMPMLYQIHFCGYSNGGFLTPLSSELQFSQAQSMGSEGDSLLCKLCSPRWSRQYCHDRARADIVDTSHTNNFVVIQHQWYYERLWLDHARSKAARLKITRPRLGLFSYLCYGYNCQWDIIQAKAVYTDGHNFRPRTASLN